MSTRELRNLTPPIAANPEEPRQWKAVGASSGQPTTASVGPPPQNVHRWVRFPCLGQGIDHRRRPRRRNEHARPGARRRTNVLNTHPEAPY
jgi:hypothetical protein